MSNQRRNRIPQIIVGQLSVALLIIMISLVLIFYSQGWRVNLKNFKIYKTGLVYLMISPVPDKIYIENKEYQGNNEFYKNLVPGDYDIRVIKDGYVDWVENIKIEEEMVSAEKNVMIFLSKPVISDLTDQSKIDYLNSPEISLAENARNKLAYNKYEIWSDDKLVTRFSEPIMSVSWYPDYEHIIYQKNNQIRIISKDGFNDTGLVNLSNSTPVKFMIGGQGKELYYIDSGQYKKAIIQ